MCWQNSRKTIKQKCWFSNHCGVLWNVFYIHHFDEPVVKVGSCSCSVTVKFYYGHHCDFCCTRFLFELFVVVVDSNFVVVVSTVNFLRSSSLWICLWSFPLWTFCCGRRCEFSCDCFLYELFCCSRHYEFCCGRFPLRTFSVTVVVTFVCGMYSSHCELFVVVVTVNFAVVVSTTRFFVVWILGVGVVVVSSANFFVVWSSLWILFVVDSVTNFLVLVSTNFVVVVFHGELFDSVVTVNFL